MISTAVFFYAQTFRAHLLASILDPIKEYPNPIKTSWIGIRFQLETKILFLIVSSISDKKFSLSVHCFRQKNALMQLSEMFWPSHGYHCHSDWSLLHWTVCWQSYRSKGYQKCHLLLVDLATTLKKKRSHLSTPHSSLHSYRLILFFFLWNQITTAIAYAMLYLLKLIDLIIRY